MSDDTYTIKLTLPQIQIIEQALVELPFKIVAPLLKDLMDQIQNNQNPTNNN